MGSAKDAWDSIQAEWGKSTNMRRSHAQETLNWTEYTEGTDIQEHIKLLQTRRAMVDNMCTQVMSDETWKGVIICSIPPTTKWLPVIPFLYLMTTLADIISTLFAHGMICYGSPVGIPRSNQEVVSFLTHVFTRTFHHFVSHIVSLPNPFHMSVSFNDVYATILLHTYAGL
jgi:hypothetical protein